MTKDLCRYPTAGIAPYDDQCAARAHQYLLLLSMSAEFASTPTSCEGMPRTACVLGWGHGGEGSGRMSPKE
jgi:hypothetical protein